MSGDSDFDKVEELVGGLTNALNRGEPVNIAARTFLNAGYSPQAVDMAVKTVMGSDVEVMQKTEEKQPMNPPEIKLPPQKINLHAQRSPEPQQLAQEQPVQSQTQESQQMPQNQNRSKGGSYIIIIVLLIFSLAVIIGAGILGLYWNKLFT